MLKIKHKPFNFKLAPFFLADIVIIGNKKIKILVFFVSSEPFPLGFKMCSRMWKDTVYSHLFIEEFTHEIPKDILLVCIILSTCKRLFTGCSSKNKNFTFYVFYWRKAYHV